MASIRWAVIVGSKSVQQEKPQAPPKPRAQDDGLGAIRGFVMVLKFYLILVGAAVAVYLFFLILRHLTA